MRCNIAVINLKVNRTAYNGADMDLKKLAKKPALFLRGEMDEKQLRKIFPQKLIHKKLPDAVEYRSMRSAYDQYIKDISNKNMAVSWETSCYMQGIARARHATKILDLGSGFSSYVFREYAKKFNHNAVIHSVDDNEFWLEKTKSFLAGFDMPIDNLIALPNFQKENKLKFDLIFHDLGNMTTRAQLLPLVLKVIEPNGLLILDDMHKKKYRVEANREIKKAGLSIFSLRKYTLDEIGRFAAIALKVE